MNQDIKIWTVEEGEPTAIRIKDMILPILNNRSIDIDPIEVAQMFIETFDLSKPIGRINKKSSDDIKPDKHVSDKKWCDIENIIDANDLSDVVDELYGIPIKKTYLDFLYRTLKESEFTSDDVIKKCKVNGIGAVRIATYLLYLEKKGTIESHEVSGLQKTYSFIKPIDEIDYNTKPEQTTQDRCIVSGRTRIDANILTRLYHRYNSEVFTVHEARNFINFSRKNSEKRVSYSAVLDHINYMTIVRIAENQNSTPNGKKFIKFLLPPEKWILHVGNDINTTTDIPQIITTPFQKQVVPDFDSGELKRRRALEMETARRDKI